jgi:hypothetical protein
VCIFVNVCVCVSDQIRPGAEMRLRGGRPISAEDAATAIAVHPAILKPQGLFTSSLSRGWPPVSAHLRFAERIPF